MLVDSHCHLDYVASCEGMGDVGDIISRAKLNDVEHMLCVCVDLDQAPSLLKIANKYDGVSASVGVHPTDVDLNDIVSVANLLQHAENEKVVAFGETGLDYFRCSDKDGVLAQQKSLVHHIEAAKEIGKPLIIHARDSFGDIYSLLEKTNAKQVGGVMHCFTGTLDQAKRAIDLGFELGIGGVVTFKNGGIDKFLNQIDLKHIVLETDSPYLAPVPHRGKRNESSYIMYVVEKLSEIYGLSKEEIADITTKNAEKVFAL